MSFLQLKNIKFQGLTVCLPRTVRNNMEYDVIPIEQRQKFVDAIGIETRRVSDKTTCTSDLCYKAAEHLINALGWERDTIDLIVFVSQTPDYKMPATSCLLQERLHLPKTTMTIDISQGCSGYVYGLGVAGALLSSGTIKRGLLLVGNTQTKNLNYKDKSVYPLFSDAGSATALEFSPNSFDEFKLSYGTDGSGEKTIYIPDGGYRNMVNEDSLSEETFEGGIVRNKLNLVMKGDDVFSFVTANIPKFTDDLFKYFNESHESIDFYLLHQASKFICNKLKKKLRIPDDKAPLLLKEFGNISNVSIPLLMTTLSEILLKQQLKLYISGFGVGLSLGVGIIKVGPLKCADIIEFEH